MSTIFSITPTESRYVPTIEAKRGQKRAPPHSEFNPQGQSRTSAIPHAKRRRRKPAHATGLAFDAIPLDTDASWIDLPIDGDAILAHAKTTSGDDHAVVLSDELDENWLDGRGIIGILGDTTPKFGECPLLEDALKAHCIDLHSEFLIRALNTTPGDKTIVPLTDTQTSIAPTALAPVSYTAASDVSWDLD